MFELFVGIIALSAFLSYLNAKFLKLPETIGVMILSIIVSLLFAASYFIDNTYFHEVTAFARSIDFKTILFDFLLGVLLFAGAIHVNLKGLLKEKSPVLIYATFGVIASTFIIGTLFYFLAKIIGLEISYLYSLVFGALISPTDPVAVLALLKKAGAPKHMEIKIIGESLFNDGVGIVVFLSILSLATMMHEFDITHIASEFGKEAGGGLLLGFIFGQIGKRCIQSVNKEPVIAVHISLAIVLGGYVLSNWLHISGAIAMVIAGLIIGHGLHNESVSENLRNHMNIFWKVLDEVFNAVLFVLIGIVMITLDFNIYHLVLGILSIFGVLFSRYITVLMSNLFLKKSNRATKKESVILTWAGLRGGISIALALSLPEGEIKDIIVYATYVVVVFSIIAQGLTVERLINKLLK
ncbi:sodium:proton antiporter [Ichthyenterobacterium sp. W332]|uniref:Sodium:proton antiporter n=1 Tax=Microcosmobacter mediterraneus TaxID=3075607 RepID=A0ABU2YM92_9FLAO|nr:sodium:proton antiporter [Ichthyenterobacterium sp. W332]MDT0559001.1 sodium:proton antiporter [Ichthyenterobacterium sp. W332]